MSPVVPAAPAIGGFMSCAARCRRRPEFCGAGPALAHRAPCRRRTAPARAAGSLLKGFALARRCRRAGGERFSSSWFALTTRTAHPWRRGVGASALAAGRAPDRRAVERPAHGEAVVQRPARSRAAGRRSHRARLYAARRPLDYIDGKAVAAIVYQRRAMSSICSSAGLGSAPRRDDRECRASISGAGATGRPSRRSAISPPRSSEFGEKFEAALKQ